MRPSSTTTGGPGGPDPAHEILAFTEELASSPGSGSIIDRLGAGHEPDGQGWCRHAAHAHRWDRHPCAVLRFVALVGEASDRPRTRR